MTTNFELAPPAVTVAGTVAVPIDISAVTARLVFDAATSTATGDATLEFVVGATAGNPIFDLRQPVTGCWLDGASLPVAQVRTLDLGGGPGAEVKVLDTVLGAGSAHTLRLTYAIGLPASPAGGGYPPGLTWSAGPRLAWNVGYTDLVPARYLEAWIPANLVWDQFALTVEVVLSGTGVPHRLITNGAVTASAANHWTVSFPATTAAESPLLEVRALDTLASVTGTVTLPVSGTAVTVEVLKPASNTTFDLSAALADLGAWLADNEQTVGPYPHGNRFTAFLIQGGMEYDGACTATPGTLRHEAFHSWWGRSMKPAGGPDGWIDEGWNTYHDGGGAGVVPFSFTDPPVTLSPRSPYSRSTPGAAYGTGERLFEGIAALSAPASLTGWMREFWGAHHDRPTTTEALEAHLLSRSGSPDVVDAFHRWVYGFGDTPGADLWLRDDPGHAGSEFWPGRFWDSPDLWIRNADDGGATHQQPVAGRDNWFHARIRNQGSAVARHFAVSFAVKQFAGMQFSWPHDFLPSVTAAVGFDLAPGASTVVKARWPAAAVPPVGTHACWLAAVLSRTDKPVGSPHVWEHGNLAQKNLTVVRGRPGAVVRVPFVSRGLLGGAGRFEIRRPPEFSAASAQLVRFSPRPVPTAAEVIARLGVARPQPAGTLADAFDPGDAGVDPRVAEFDPGTALGLEPGGARFPLPVGPARLGLLLRIPPDADSGTVGTFDLVRRDEAGQILGGIAVRVEVE